MKKITEWDRKICWYCGKELFRRSGERSSDYRTRKFCNRTCYHSYHVGINHPNYKGGIKTRSDGYLRFSTDEYVHRKLMEEYMGRKLSSNEHVHHINGNPKDNRIENLMLLTNSEHRKLENKTAKRDQTGRYTKYDK